MPRKRSILVWRLLITKTGRKGQFKCSIIKVVKNPGTSKGKHSIAVGGTQNGKCISGMEGSDEGLGVQGRKRRRLDESVT